jgi:transposase
MQPVFIRPLTEDERSQIGAGLRSSDAFVLRRSQILLASSRGERAQSIAESVGCNDQTVRNVIKGFNACGLGVLHRKSSRPHRLRSAFTDQGLQAFKALLHRSPRDFGHPTSVWTLDLAAEVSFTQGLTSTVLSGEAIRKILKRGGINWKRAKHRISSPDPQYLQKKRLVTI